MGCLPGGWRRSRGCVRVSAAGAGHLHHDGLRALVVQRLAQRAVEERRRAQSTSCSSRPRPQQYQSRVGRPRVLHRRKARPKPSGSSASSRHHLDAHHPLAEGLPGVGASPAPRRRTRARWRSAGSTISRPAACSPGCGSASVEVSPASDRRHASRQVRARSPATNCQTNQPLTTALSRNTTTKSISRATSRAPTRRAAARAAAGAGGRRGQVGYGQPGGGPAGPGRAAPVPVAVGRRAGGRCAGGRSRVRPGRPAGGRPGPAPAGAGGPAGPAGGGRRCRFGRRRARRAGWRRPGSARRSSPRRPSTAGSSGRRGRRTSRLHAHGVASRSRCNLNDDGAGELVVQALLAGLVPELPQPVERS